jgi:hypothetical protein
VTAIDADVRNSSGVHIVNGVPYEVIKDGYPIPLGYGMNFASLEVLNNEHNPLYKTQSRVKMLQRFSQAMLDAMLREGHKIMQFKQDDVTVTRAIVNDGFLVEVRRGDTKYGPSLEAYTLGPSGKIVYAFNLEMNATNFLRELHAREDKWADERRQKALKVTVRLGSTTSYCPQEYMTERSLVDLVAQDPHMRMPFSATDQRHLQ